MKYVQPFSLLLLGAALLLNGCTEQKPEGDTPAGDSLHGANDSGANAPDGRAGVVNVPTETPTGRTELPTAQTIAPNLWITLPQGFSVRADTTLGYDILVVSRIDDPLLNDSSAVPYGMLRIVVGDSAISVTPNDVKSAERQGIIGAYPGRWRYYTGVIPDGATYYSYELAANDYFARISPDRAMKKLRLHLYIAGKDTAVIGQLIKAAESISIKP